MELNRANGSRRGVEEEIDKEKKGASGRIMQCVT